VSERSERNPGIESPLIAAPALAGEELVHLTVHCAPSGRGNLIYHDPGVARPAVAYPWLPSATATRFDKERNPTGRYRSRY
jgi:hypothetical protein